MRREGLRGYGGKTTALGNENKDPESNKMSVPPLTCGVGDACVTQDKRTAS